MRKNPIHSALFRIFVPIPYGSFIYLLLLIINNNLLALNESFLSAELLFCIILSYLVFESNRLFLTTIFSKSARIGLPYLMRLLANSTITLIVVYLALTIYFVWILGYTSILGFDTEIKSFFSFFGITSLLYTSLSTSYDLLTMKNLQLIEDEEVLREQVRYELEVYQSEVNPELLFESLESALELMDKDIDMAEEYIDELALVYRYILSNREKEVVSLANEVNAANNLVRLHNVRYKDLIALESSIDCADLRLIPGSLPLIIEEIISNTLITNNRPLNIVLAREDNYLTLSHKTNERLTFNPHEAMTFERLQNAYAYFSDQPLVKVQAYGDSFYKIPIINKPAA